MYPEGILLQHELYDNLLKTIERDCRVLESFHIMDYSLLIGVHNLDVAARTANNTNLEELCWMTETDSLKLFYSMTI